MRRTITTVLAAGALVGAVPVGAAADPPDNPSATGQCASTTAQERQGSPEEPSVSFPFECPPPPGHRG
jgi:hypothetical protein